MKGNGCNTFHALQLIADVLCPYLQLACGVTFASQCKCPDRDPAKIAVKTQPGRACGQFSLRVSEARPDLLPDLGYNLGRDIFVQENIDKHTARTNLGLDQAYLALSSDRFFNWTCEAAFEAISRFAGQICFDGRDPEGDGWFFRCRKIKECDEADYASQNGCDQNKART